MFNDSVSFNGGTRVEVIAVLANCGRDTDRARRALVTWIRHKQGKGRSTEHILAKLRDIESKFIKDTSLHSAFRDARAETFLPKAPDLPLPSFIRRRSERRAPESLASPNSARPSSVSSPIVELTVHSPQPSSPSVSPVRLSRDSSQIFPAKLNTNRRISLPQGVPHVPQYPPPRIKIPSTRSLQPGPNSPITSSPEDSGFHLRYRYMSHPVGPNKVSLPSANSPEFPPSPALFHDRKLDRGFPHGFVPPTLPPPIQIPHPRSQRSYPNSPRTSSSDESELHRYHYMGHPSVPMSPGRRRVTPPRTSPPAVPLPPIPADEQDTNSNSGMPEQSLLDKQPSTPVQCTAWQPSTPARPLPIQPIPIPIPGSDESEPTDTINRNSLRQNWQGSSGELPPDDIVREDSPVYVFHDDRACQTGISPPPPYGHQLNTCSPTDMPTIGDVLDRAVNVCGGSPEVRLEVSKCIGFCHGYEPPYWQTRLQACGLNAEAAKYLVDEMSKQVNWAASFGRAT